MSAFLLVPGLVLLLVGLAAGLRVAERQIPGLTEFLDRHVGEEPEWKRW